MLRVLHVYRTYFPELQGGLQESIRQICFATRSRGITSRVFALSRQPEPRVIRREEADVYRFPLHLEIASAGFSAGAFRGFKALVEWADLVNYHFPWPFADLLHIVGRVKKPVVVTYHSDIVRQKVLLPLYQPLMEHFLGQADRIVATSPEYARTSPLLKRFADKVEIIPIALDESTYPRADEQRIARLSRDVGQDFFLFVGVLRYYKGLHILLDAVRDTDLPVVVVGEGPERPHLERTIDAFRMNNVQLLGYVDDRDKVALLRLARAIVFPSYLRSEAFGVTLLEGAMYAKPLISCEIGTGTSYVNRDGETGLVVPPGDPAALRAAMLRLTEDAALATRLGRGARARYDRLFAGTQMGERYALLYDELVYTARYATEMDLKGSSR